MRSARTAARRAGVAALLLLAAACGGGGGGKGGVQVTLRDFKIDLAATTVAPGTVRFTARNEGPSIHELEVFSVPAGVDPDHLPIEANVADTEGPGLEVVDEVEDIAPSTSVSLTVSLDPGTYILICNLPGHYQQGMHVALTAG
jgi:uncharacterized cupredoxin-like copper-binding protein